jgi:MFS family permease
VGEETALYGRSLRTLSAAFGCFGVFWGVWAVSATDIKHALHLSDGGFGVLLSVALLVAAGANAAAGSLVERWGTRTALIRVLIAWAVLLVAGGTVGNPGVFGVLLVAIVSVGGSFDVVINVAGSAALAQQPGRFVRLHGWFNAGAIVGAGLSEVVLQAGWSWRWIWLAIAACALVLAFVCRGVDLPASGVGGRHGVLEGLRAVREHGYLVLAVAFGASAMVEGGVETWGVLFLRETLASGVLVGAAAYMLGQAVATSSRFMLGPAADALGTRRSVAFGAGLAACGLVLMVTAPAAVVAAVGLVAAAAGISLCWPLLVAHMSATAERPGLIIGGVTSIGYLGFVIGPVFVGWVSQGLGLRAGLSLLAVAALFVVATATRA